MHSVPDERPDWFRTIVAAKTIRRRALETKGIAISQLDLRLTCPVCLSRCSPFRKPSLDLNAAMKHAM